MGAAATSADERALIARFESAGQGHVFRFLAELAPRERAELFASARGIDLDRASRLLDDSAPAAAHARVEPPGDEFVPFEVARRLAAEAEERGLDELQRGRVAVVVAAGGQGTRMGSAAPKGMWPVGPASGKPLLQWHAEKALHWSRRLRRPVPFVVMVSAATQRATEDFLRWHNWFGLDPTWVRTPCQGANPPLDDEGKLLLETKSRIALAPNGHGGLFRALADAKLLDLFADHGVRTLSYVQVDNPLVRVIDPVFLGLHALRGSEISSKAVAKTDAAEKVGVFARADGKPAVVEYTELTDEQARAKGPGGALLFGHGSIAAHAIDLAFARRMAAEGLPLHRARKKVPFVDAAGREVAPDAPNATKFETFLFDAIPRAARSLVLETARAEEFSPLKSNEGRDSPKTVREDLLALFRGWYERAGLPVPAGALEVDPSKAPDEAAFRRLHGLS